MACPSCHEIVAGWPDAGRLGLMSSFGALLGHRSMGRLNGGMSLMNRPTFSQASARGIVVPIAVAIDVVRRRRAGSS
jgi:ABC-type xylose transport system permease subunit